MSYPLLLSFSSAGMFVVGCVMLLAWLMLGLECLWLMLSATWVVRMSGLVVPVFAFFFLIC